MNSILQKICADKRHALERLKREKSLAVLQEEARNAPVRRDFKAAVSRAGSVNIIAELKKASPSAGVLKGDMDPVKLAADYETGGAVALSVLTEEEYFKGDLRYIAAVKKAVSLPVLRKDFIFDPYQVYESAAAGADAILLIAAIVDMAMLKNLVSLAHAVGLACLVEVHDEADLEKALETPASIVGINNRDLNDFAVRLETAERIAAKMPAGKTIVVESGIKTVDDIRRYHAAGIHAFLIGETLVRSNDSRGTLETLRGAVNG